MYDTGLGLSTYSTFELKRIDSDYFGGESVRPHDQAVE